MTEPLKLILLFFLVTGCAKNNIAPSEPLPIETSSFYFGRTRGANTFAPTPYNLYKVSGNKLFGAYVPIINPDSLALYPMKVVSQEKYRAVADLESLLPVTIFSETAMRLGLINIDSGYDFIRISREAGDTKFFYIGDGGVPDYLIPFKQALDQDLAKLSN